MANDGTPDSKGVSASIPDFVREYKSWADWNPSRSLIASIRSSQRIRSNRLLRAVVQKTAVLRHRFWSAVTGADIPIQCQIGGGLLMPHPNGIVIHPDAVIGPNCLLFQQVTIGQSNSGVPVIGGHVDIGAGAKILGAISIGDHAVVGANAVVLRDIPMGATAVGVPASIVTQRKEE